VTKIKCDYCGNSAKLVTGEEIYPHRRDLASKKFYSCTPCKAYVGTYKDGKPLGRLANKELRVAKQKAHGEFDPLWKSGYMSRGRAYGWLSIQMDLPKEKTHIGMFTEKQCKQVVDICRKAKSHIGM
jgi:hypothetical protein